MQALKRTHDTSVANAMLSIMRKSPIKEKKAGSNITCNGSKVYITQIAGQLVAFMRNKHGRWVERALQSIQRIQEKGDFIRDMITKKIISFNNLKEVRTYIDFHKNFTVNVI